MDTSDLIGANDQVQQALRLAIAKVMEMDANEVYVRAGYRRIVVNVGDCNIDIRSDGIRVESSYASRATIEKTKTQVAKAITLVLGLMAQAKTVAALKSKYRVTNQTTARNGAVMITIETGG
ncbi:MAG: hypothetical protein KKH61_21045 [Gammaproteobacteria bacterium]|nr:hypothetical protein [Gammaproteobacteria bacterium]